MQAAPSWADSLIGTREGLPAPQVARTTPVKASDLAPASDVCSPATPRERSGAAGRIQTGPILAPNVTVLAAVKREITEKAAVTGTLVPFEEILIMPEIEGQRVVEVLVDEGTWVEKDQVLARLSRDVITIQLMQNAATLGRAEATTAQARSQIVQADAAQVESSQGLERARSLVKSGNTTEVILEQRISAARIAEGRFSAARDTLLIAESDKAASEAQRRELMWRLSRTEVRAPVAGIVSRKSTRVGATATAAGEPMFRLIADGRIEFEAEIIETDLARIKTGASATVVINGKREIAGRVRNVLPEIDRATRLGKLRIMLEDSGVRIGSFARGTVEIARQDSIAVPLSSVLYTIKGPIVQVVADNTVETRAVGLGLVADGFVEITQGLTLGDLVVVRAGSFLRNGDPVRYEVSRLDRAQ